ncbi:OLC1v1023940C3 [Oldenlandia corymbosa var. corymbosa]|uniref:OLC1v1023940C3 n=1 Tax=Oldenlandia corymbosa var. corymbosa TaxID=529605 RepID=A0AAV1C136_OLDCO|nr:OLC1v1023940C3 [Oldenlandia corymbosa var. corymbosa]
MEGSVRKKGTVTPISSLFSPEDTQKASERVQQKIAEQHKHLDVLKGFISENTDLINLVQTLPNELQHQIMVPWGKAAFFPGQLVHTNEFVVLLGDGYYAERTSKQTVDILRRRHKVLESQVDSAKAEIQDLKTEASFFNVTAHEAASGLVQIVEDYDEERPFHDASNSGSYAESEQEKTGNEDNEYERIMARLSELEKEEEAAENGAENGDENEESEEDEQEKTGKEDDDYERIMTRLAELEEKEEAAENDYEIGESEDEADQNQNENQFSRDEVVRHSGVNDQKQPSMFKGVMPQAQAPASYKSSLRENAAQLPEIKENLQASLAAKHEASIPPSQPRSSTTNKAFTGSVVERSYNLGMKPPEETTASSSKPVSRFKMNRK